MGQYSIKDLERLSGIKAHTIRIWEKRYDLIQPQRTQTNIRYYSDDDLKKLLNVSLLNHHGHKISKIAELSRQELAKKIEEHTVLNNDYQFHIDRFVVTTIDMDEEGFGACLDECIINYGMEKTMIEIVYPFFTKVGTLWMTGSINPGQEHLISNLVRSKLILAIERRSKSVEQKGPTAMFVLPENEWHELGLLFHQLIAVDCGLRTVYLGQSVPYSTVEATLKVLPARFIITSHLSVKDPRRLVDHLVRLSEAGGDAKILLVDRTKASLAIEADERFYVANDLEEFKEMLKT